jgi:hypothetical protein
MKRYKYINGQTQVIFVVRKGRDALRASAWRNEPLTPSEDAAFFAWFEPLRKLLEENNSILETPVGMTFSKPLAPGLAQTAHLGVPLEIYLFNWVVGENDEEPLVGPIE